MFLKGIRTDHPAVVAQQRAAVINPYVRAVTRAAGGTPRSTAGICWPPSLWKAGTPTIRTGSSDFPKVVDVLTRAGDIRAPELRSRSLSNGGRRTSMSRRFWSCWPATH